MSAEEAASLERAAHELVRVDSLFGSYVGPQLAARLHEEPEFGELGGKEADVTVLFADLAGFTTFSEGKGASDVIGMLNRYWEGVVPVVVEAEGGLIERFAGDAIMAVFNALEAQPDHALRGVRAALAMQAYTQATAAEHPDWPRFRIGVNTGTAVIGTVGATDQRSFAAIGDTTNVAARVQALARTGASTPRGRHVSADARPGPRRTARSRVVEGQDGDRRRLRTARGGLLTSAGGRYP